MCVQWLFREREGIKQTKCENQTERERQREMMFSELCNLCCFCIFREFLFKFYIYLYFFSHAHVTSSILNTPAKEGGAINEEKCLSVVSNLILIVIAAAAIMA